MISAQRKSKGLIVLRKYLQQRISAMMFDMWAPKCYWAVWTVLVKLNSEPVSAPKPSHHLHSQTLKGDKSTLLLLTLMKQIRDDSGYTRIKTDFFLSQPLFCLGQIWVSAGPKGAKTKGLCIVSTFLVAILKLPANSAVFLYKRFQSFFVIIFTLFYDAFCKIK